MKCLLIACLSVVVKTNVFGNIVGAGVVCAASQLHPPLSHVNEKTS